MEKKVRFKSFLQTIGSGAVTPATRTLESQFGMSTMRQGIGEFSLSQ
jgi:hypothetical protein